MLTEKYRPKSIEEVIGNEEAKKKAKEWLSLFLKGKEKRPLFIYGPTGIGKTSLAYALASSFDLQPIFFTSSEKREGKTLKQMQLTSGLSIFGVKRLVIIDDLEGIASKEDRGGMEAIVSIIKESKNPIILIANDFWDQRFKGLRQYVFPLEMKKPNVNAITKLLEHIAEKERIKIEKEEIKEIAMSADGDVRAAINNLEARSVGYRDKKKGIYEVILSILKGRDLEWPRKTLLQTDEDLDLIKAWLDENIPIEYANAKERAEAYNYLSKADVYSGRIVKRQYWGFLRYVSFFIANIALVSKEKKSFIKYRFPSYIKDLSSTMAKRAMVKEIAKKIGKKTHTNYKSIIGELQFYKKLILKNKEEAKHYFMLNDNEMNFLEGYDG